MAILNKMDLAKYIISKYIDEFGTDISPIKLHKSLYFLYAYWGSKIELSKIKSDDIISEMVEMDFSDYDEQLFDADFEAWTYGPVDRDIYLWCKENHIDTSLKYSLNVEKEILDYIDDLLIRIFNSSDFGLVDLCQEDDCWKSAYNPLAKNKIDSKTIIKEYMNK